MFSPVERRRLPGFAAIRGLNMRDDLPPGQPPLEDWTAQIDLWVLRARTPARPHNTCPHPMTYRTRVGTTRLTPALLPSPP